MYSDPEIDAIFCARGGWGCLRYVDQLDFELIRRNPKMLVGYSDITTLQLAIYHKTGIPSFSGPMVAVEMGRGILEFTGQHFWGQLYNKEDQYRINLMDVGAAVLRPGQAEGTLLGGCLSLVACQLGSDFMPDFRNAILFIEDVGESSYKIDRYLAQLRQAGILDEVSGVILGEFIDCDPEPDDTDSFPVRDILLDYFGSASVPVVESFPYGHGMKKIAMPLGVQVAIDTKKSNLIFTNPFSAAE
jgi:muramoyltetrapeptide carboxypeptidase